MVGKEILLIKIEHRWETSGEWKDRMLALRMEFQRVLDDQEGIKPNHRPKKEEQEKRMEVIPSSKLFSTTRKGVGSH